jgi:hypothetical protein
VTGSSTAAYLQIRPIWILWSHKESTYGPGVRGDSEIKTMKDMAKSGLKIGVMAGGATRMPECHYIYPAFAGVTHEWAEENWEFIETPGYSAGVRMLGEGKFDVFTGHSPQSGISREVAAGPYGLRWLPMDFDNEEGWAAMDKYVPGLGKAKHELGVESAKGVEGYSEPFFTMVSTGKDGEWGLPVETQYHLAKWYDEHYDLVKDVHSTSYFMSLDCFRDALDEVIVTPVCPGTVKYLKEIGKWTAEDDKWNAKAEKIMFDYIEASKAAHDEAIERNLQVSLDSEEWMELWGSYKEGLPVLSTCRE